MEDSSRASDAAASGEQISSEETALFPAAVARASDLLDRAKAGWRDLLHGLWFIPGLIALTLALLAVLLTEVEQAVTPSGLTVGFSGGASAARLLLSTIAGSLITVAGLAFSITILLLQLVSAQFTPRAVRGFLGDRLTQVAVGAFVGIFAYCLLVLRTVRDRSGGSGGFVPGLSVTVAIALALVGLGLLVAFIHHMARSTQVSRIAAKIAADTLAAVGELYPEPYGEPLELDGEQLLQAWEAETERALVYPSRPGYVRTIRLDELASSVPRGGLRLLISARPGEFVTELTPIASIWPRRLADEQTIALVGRSVVVADERDIVQDVAYGIRQLTDIANKALSPGINDPTTAVTCIGYLQAVLERLAERAMPSLVRRFPNDELTIVARARSFHDCATSLAEIGRFAAANPNVACATLAALERIARAAAAAKADKRVSQLVELTHETTQSALENASTDRERELLTEPVEALDRLIERDRGEQAQASRSVRTPAPRRPEARH